MSGISKFSNVTINLTRTPKALVNFGVAMHLVDHADIPVDKRYRVLTRGTYAALLTPGTDHLAWCEALWGQSLNPSEMYLTRWISAATLAYLVLPNATTVVADWAALAATGQFKLVEGAANEDIAPDFTGDTSMDDVCASIQAALAASTLGASYTCALDILNRVVITSDLSGAGSDALSIEAPVAGIDLSLPAWLDGATAINQDGMDAETHAAAMNAVLAVDNSPFIMTERGGDTAEQVDFSTAVNALDKIFLCVSHDVTCKSAGSSTDVAFLIHANADQQTHVEYTEHTDDDPDAAICGEIMPYTEAKRSFALWPLLGLHESGLSAAGESIPLTDVEVIALEAKGADYLAKPRNVVHFANGLASGGNEMRIMVGKFFCEAMISADVYAYELAQDVVTYSDDDILAVQGIMERWLDEMVARKVLEPGYTVEMPSAADFTAAVKATHIMDLNNVAEADAQISVNQINATLSWAI